jgi:protein ImuA
VPADPQLLQRLRSHIAAIERGGSGTPHNDDCLPLGLPDIDDHLPWGGLAAGAVHEILDGDSPTSNSTTRIGGALNGAVTAFAAALAGKAQRARARPIVWIAPRTGPRESLYAPGLAGFGLDPADLIAVRIPPGGDFAATALWAMEETLRASTVGLVCAEIEDMSLTASRRLQLAAETGAETGGGLGLLLRRDTGNAPGAALPPTACVSRWRIAALPGGPAEYANLPGVTRWQAELLRVRGGRPRTWQLEWSNDGHDKSQAAGGFALVPPLRDRSLSKEPQTADERPTGQHEKRRTA